MRSPLAPLARALVALLALCTAPAWSADVVVSSSADSGPGSLREALTSAVAGDTIVFALPNATTIAAASTLSIGKDLTIDGAAAPGLTIGGNPAVAALQIESGVTARIAHLTIADAGTGIVNRGMLTVTASTLRGNMDGAIASGGNVVVADSTFSGNASPTLGGGILISAGSATVVNSTFVGNTARYGGAVCSASASPSTLRNNVFVANGASQSGGAVEDAFGAVAADHNLYWDNADANGAQASPCHGCASNTLPAYADPLLGPLADNGGPTRTHAPALDSAAIDRGDDVACSAAPVAGLDQRGVVRPHGAHCDLGAVESNERVFADGFQAPPGPVFYGFETCLDGWVLSGDWQCGVPQFVGPPAAFEGTQVLGTGIAGNYSNNNTWSSTTATSPDIDLIGLPHPTLTFRMWVDTEGASYDGGNVQISIDGGATYTVVTSVTPAYTATIAGKPAWGGHQAALGWQAAQADLSAYAGHVVRLRFAFQSDSSGTFPGLYLDALSVQ